jgi:hypothetical protein
VRPGEAVGGELGGGGAGGGFCANATGARNPAKIANPTATSTPALSLRKKRIKTFAGGTLVNQSLGLGSVPVKMPVRHFFVSNGSGKGSGKSARGANPRAEEDNFMTAALRFVDKDGVTASPLSRQMGESVLRMIVQTIVGRGPCGARNVQGQP